VSAEQITYSWDDEQYNVSRFTDEAKLAFACLVESKQEITFLTRKITTLQAATITLSQKINSQLTDEMSITPEDHKDSETTN
tara:strand:- start:51 stop:296 length:246 start_codon:yes stop_codon:yes gene_type:complete